MDDITYKNFLDENLFHVYELMYNNAKDKAIDNYETNHKIWAANVIHWADLLEEGKAVFKLAFKDNKLIGFVIGVPTVWQYSNSFYLDLKEVIVDETLSQTNKIRVVTKFSELAEMEAKRMKLKGLSTFSIRDNSQAYANFFCKRLGWTPATGAKKIFSEEI